MNLCLETKGTATTITDSYQGYKKLEVPFLSYEQILFAELLDCGHGN